MTPQTARISDLLAPVRDADASDAELLSRFVTDRDDSAFAVLVARHGPMVFGACRRIVGDWHAAEDAYQATFLVLARRASSVAPPGAVAGWLHGVACRVAKDSRRAKLRRVSRERPTTEVPDPVTEPPDARTDLRAVLDDELRKLPRKYRDLLIVCDLEDRARAPVAAALGIPEGTLSSRLTTARKMLAARLTKRGIAPAVAASATLGGAGTSVTACDVPRAVLASAARLRGTTTDTVSAPVASLASGAIRAMIRRTWAQIALFVLVSVGAFGAALTAVGRPLSPGVPEPVPEALTLTPPAPEPRSVRAGGILFYRAGYLVLIDPDGKNERKLNPGQKQFLYGQAKLSPDGKSVAVMVHTNLASPTKPLINLTENRRLYVRGLNEPEPGTDLGVVCDQFTWSRDGTEIVCHDIKATGDPPSRNFIVNVKTKKKVEIKVGKTVQITDWSHDGKHFLTSHIDGVFTQTQYPPCYICLTNREGVEHTVLTSTKEFALFGRLSPDGTRMLYQADIPSTKERPGTREIRVLDTKTKEAARVTQVPPNGTVSSFCWSPDGRRIAYTWKEDLQPTDAPNKELESRLIVCDPDGKNAKTLATEKGVGKYLVTIGGVDWR